MKRAAALLLALAALGAAGMVCTHWTVSASAEAVELRETVLSGDRAAAEGVEVTFASWYGPCAWDSRLSIGTESLLRTEFSFGLGGGGGDDVREYSGLSADISLPYYYEVAPGRTLTEKYEYLHADIYRFGMENNALAAILTQVAEHAGPGASQRNTESVCLNDYIDYLPLEISADLPCLSGAEPEHRCINDYEQVIRQLEEYFRLPVPEKCMAEVTVEKNEDGYVTKWSIEFADGWRPGAYVQNAVTENACYFALTDTTGETDLSALPAGRGIYCLPLERVGDCTRAAVEKLSPVFRLGEDEELEGIDVYGESLLLLVRRGSELWLTCVDLSGTGGARSICMLSYGGRNRVGHTVLENGAYYLETDERAFALAEPADGGGYRVCISETIGDTDWRFDAGGNSTKIAWDGERMTAAQSFAGDVDENGAWELGARLWVYDETGLLCRLRYDSSLSLAPYAPVMEFGYPRSGRVGGNIISLA